MATIHRLYFYDDFYRYRGESLIDDDSYYQPAGGSLWSVSSGTTNTTATSAHPLFTRASFVDCAVRVMVKNVTTGSSMTSTGALIFRACNEDWYYRMQLCTDGSLRAFYHSSGADTAAGTSGFNSTLSVWNEIAVRSIGQQHIGYVNGRAAITISNGPVPKAGHVGLSSNNTAYFAGLAVYDNSVLGRDYLDLTELAITRSVDLSSTPMDSGALGGSSVNEHRLPEKIALSFAVKSSSVPFNDLGSYEYSARQFLDSVVNRGEGLYINSLQFTGSVIPTVIKGPQASAYSAKMARINIDGIVANYR